MRYIKLYILYLGRLDTYVIIHSLCIIMESRHTSITMFRLFNKMYNNYNK